MIRTDLAVEAREMHGKGVEGVAARTEEKDGVSVTTVEITTPEGADKMGKPMGTYVTIEAGAPEEPEEREKAAMALARELELMMEGKDCGHVLVVGLGNDRMTPDSVGVNAARQVFVTRHLKEYMPEQFGDARTVSSVTPGVLGTTGIETGESVAGIAQRIGPTLIIAVDALASRSMARIGKTIQLTDTGISPGSGVGNSRKELSQATLGIPVLAVGIPMVADAATVADDAIGMVIKEMREGAGDEAVKMLKGLEDDDRYALIYEALEPNAANMFVTPKDVDAIADRAAEILRDGINYALHGEKYQIFY